jgi:hypothetical protein
MFTMLSRVCRAALGACLIGLAACATDSPVHDAPVDLLGQGLEGFTRTGGANWTFSDGEARATSGAGSSLLVSRDDFGDMDLQLEVYVSAKHNSGVFVRCSDRSRITPTNCYEVNIFDQRPDQSGRTGGAPGYFVPLARVDAGGRWNTMRIRTNGPHIRVEINGVTTIDADGPLLGTGPIALQWAAGEVRFRNVKVRRLNR